jgi:hypothetical protein
MIHFVNSNITVCVSIELDNGSLQDVRFFAYIYPALKHKDKHFSAHKSDQIKLTLFNQICPKTRLQPFRNSKIFPGENPRDPHSTRAAAMRRGRGGRFAQGLGKGRGGERTGRRAEGQERGEEGVAEKELPPTFRG